LKSEQDIILKTSLDVFAIRKSCDIVSTVLREAGNLVQQGTNLLEIEQFCKELIHKSNAESAVKYFNGFPASVCISLNNVAAHGIAADISLQDGDIVTIDCAVKKNGWFGDGAQTFAVGNTDLSASRIIRAAKEAVSAGISAAKAGKRLGDIGDAITRVCTRYQCSVLKNFVGHGIGRSIHEDPKIYHFGEADTGQPIVPGMVFTIEPILTLGSDQTKTLDDGWSLVTLDNSLTAQFEYTVAVFSDHTEVLTLPETIEL
jgi:methionyl aminopeptidase